MRKLPPTRRELMDESQEDELDAVRRESELAEASDEVQAPGKGRLVVLKGLLLLCQSTGWTLIVLFRAEKRVSESETTSSNSAGLLSVRGVSCGVVVL